MKKALSPSLARIERRFEVLAHRLAHTPWVLLGTVQRRYTRRPIAPHGSVKRYGPYYQWTFKRDGKTCTVQLSLAQASAWRRAIAAHRALERTLAQMRALSEEYLNATVEGVPKRKSKTP